jgi:hypothetical protein
MYVDDDIEIDETLSAARRRDVEARDRHVARLQLDLDALAREIVGALAVHLDRRDLAGHLRDGS